MSSILPTLLPFRLLDLPRAIFVTSGGGLKDRLLFQRITVSGRNGTPLSEAELDEIALRPEMLADALRQNLLRPHERTLILNGDPSITLRAMLQSYDELAPQLERLILDDPESVERLIMFLRYRDRSGINPESLYRGLLDSDPNRAIRATQIDAEQEFNFQRFASQATAHRSMSAAWAFFYLRCQEFESIPDDVREALLKSEEYSYLAARLCKACGIISQDWAPLSNNVKSPRWVYHLLRDGLAPDTQSAINRLLDSPPWLVQYMEDVNSSPAEREELFLECQERNIKAGRFAFLDDMELWFRSKSALSLHSFIAA